MDVNMDVDRISMALPMLTKSNYQRWKFDVKLILESLELLDIVLGIEKKPAREEDIKKWRKLDAKARRVLSSGFDDQFHATIRSCSTAHEIWTMVTGLHEAKSESNKYLANQELCALKFTEGKSVAGYCAEMSTICQKLEVLGQKVEEPQKIAKLLTDLPSPKFDLFRHTYRLQAAVGTTLSFVDMQTQLQLIESDLLRATEKDADVVETGEALVAHHKQNRGRNQTGKRGDKNRNKEKQKETRTCHFCKEVGHLRNDCAKLKARKQTSGQGEGRQGQDQKEGRANVALISGAPTRRPYQSDWAMDSGASNHIVHDKSLYKTYELLKTPFEITLGDDFKLQVIGTGQIEVDFNNGDTWEPGTLNDVWHVPDMGRTNLLSTGVVTKRGYKVVFCEEDVKIENINGQTVLVGYPGDNGLYYLMIRLRGHDAKKAAGSVKLWHERLGHISVDTVKRMAKTNIVTGLDITTDDTANFYCNGCVKGKMSRKPCETRSSREVVVGARIHSDVCSMEVESISGKKYFVLFKDEASGFRKTYFIKNKSEVFEKLRDFVNEQKAERGDQMITLRTDNGTEYVNAQCTNYLKQKGIGFEKSVAYVHEQNGIAERDIRTLVELARAMIHAKKLPKCLWAEAINTATFIMNRVINRDLDKTPHELWTGEKPDIGHLRVFGTRVAAHIPKEKRKKLDEKSQDLILVGYEKTARNFRLYNELTHSVTIHKDVEFDLTSESTISAADHQIIVNEEKSDKSSSEDDGQQEDDEVEEPRKRGRPIGAKNRIYEKVDRPLRSKAQVLMAIHEPQCYEEAISCKEALHWIKSMDCEMSSHEKNGTWTLVDKPKDANVVKSKWIFKLKRNSDGSIARYKSRLVAKGYSQKKGIDYFDTWAPVIMRNSIRIVLAIAHGRGMRMVHFDVKTAFLHGIMEETLFMEQAEGYTKGNKVCKLNRAIYGTKQASRAFNKLLDKFLVKFGMTRSEADPCIYVSISETSTTILGVYVDDGLLASTDNSVIEKMIKFLEKEFELHVEELSCFIGMQVDIDESKGTLKIHQTAYITQMLEKFGMSECRTVRTPGDPAIKLRAATKDDEIANYPYREAIGSLMYAATSTRPDITFYVCKLARFMEKPTVVHVTAVKTIFRYLKGTTSRGIVYKKNNYKNLNYTDADYAGDLDERYSTSGHVCLIAGAAVAWASRLQKIQAQSTCEAEYVAAAELVKDVLWIRQLLKDIGSQAEGPSVVLCDNQGAIKIVKNPEVNGRTKHIDVRHHVIRKHQQEGHINVEYVPTGEQAADGLTKGLYGLNFEKFVRLIGME